MDHKSFDTATRRASKRLAHATRQLAEAQSERARQRHARRLHTAHRSLKDALWVFDRMAYAHEADA